MTIPMFICVPITETGSKAPSRWKQCCNSTDSTCSSVKPPKPPKRVRSFTYLSQLDSQESKPSSPSNRDDATSRNYNDDPRTYKSDESPKIPNRTYGMDGSGKLGKSSSINVPLLSRERRYHYHDDDLSVSAPPQTVLLLQPSFQ